MLLDTIRDFLRAQHAPEQFAHLRGRWNPNIETQLNTSAMYTEGPRKGKKRVYRIPHQSGSVDAHYDADTAYYPPTDKWEAIGVSGWDFQERRSIFLTFDIDAKDHSGGSAQDDSVIDELVAALLPIAEVELLRSKGGRGIHVTVYFDIDDQPQTTNHNEHGALAKPIARWLSERTGIDIDRIKDCAGFVVWIWHRDAKPDGLKLIKPSSAALPREAWDHPTDAHEAKPKATIATGISPLTTDQQRFSKLLIKRGAAEWKNGMLISHTHSVCKAVRALKLPGTFDTVAAGREGPADRNCFLFPQADGSWRCCRYGKGVKEATSWFVSRNGFTTCIFGRTIKKADAVQEIVYRELDGELFHDKNGACYSIIEHRGSKETVGIGDDIHVAYLRRTYRESTGMIASREAISTAVDELASEARNRNEYDVGIRKLYHDGAMYVALADADRAIVKLDKTGWGVVENPPVRFRYPTGILPMAIPTKGGKQADLAEFLNRDEEDDYLPLLLGWIVSTYHPSGPYPLLSITGEQGSAKSSLTRLIHEFTDPSVGILGELPDDARNLLVTAQLTNVLSYDNVDALTDRQQKLFCCIATGAAANFRTLFKNKERTILKSKNPLILTSIGEVVSRSDLAERTITICLPAIKQEQRKTEFEIEQALRREGVRGRILGYIFDAVVAALAGHETVALPKRPRMADAFCWMTAAENKLGLEQFSIVNNFDAQGQTFANAKVSESVFATTVKGLCEKTGGWAGTATELAEEVGYDYTATGAGMELAKLAPSLRELGYAVEQKKRGIKLGKKASQGGSLNS